MTTMYVGLHSLVVDVATLRACACGLDAMEAEVHAQARRDGASSPPPDALDFLAKWRRAAEAARAGGIALPGPPEPEVHWFYARLTVAQAADEANVEKQTVRR